MYMDVLEHEVEALNEEVTRLRQMVLRVTQFIEPPMEEGAAPTHRNPIAAPSRQSAPTPSGLSNYSAPSPIFHANLVEKREGNSRTLQALIENCTLDLLNVLAAFREDSSSNAKVDVERILKSHHRDRKMLKHEIRKRCHPRKHGKHSTSLSSNLSLTTSSSSSRLSAPKPRPSRHRSAQTSQAASGEEGDGRTSAMAAVVEIEPSRSPSLTSDAAAGVVESVSLPIKGSSVNALPTPGIQKSPRTSLPVVPVLAEKAAGVDSNYPNRTNQDSPSASVHLHSMNVQEGRMGLNQEEKVPHRANANDLPSQCSKGGLIGLSSQVERSYRPGSMILSQQQSHSSESSSLEIAVPKSLVTSGVHEREKPTLPITNTLTGNSSDDSTSEDDLDALKRVFGVRPEEGIRPPGSGIGFGATSPEGVRTQQLRPSVLEFIQRQDEEPSTSLSELTDGMAFGGHQSRSKTEDEGALSAPQPSQEPSPGASKSGPSLTSEAAPPPSPPMTTSHKGGGLHTSSPQSPVNPTPESPLNPSQSSLQLSGHGQIGLSANSLVGDYDYGFDLGNHSMQLKSTSLLSFPRVQGGSGTDNKGS
ncbi:unnamed protein product [Phytomonas sp. EM1]|nr:unnamed protein product [Phytomonas sp. EM1]|eukprot:CCW63301.1 unnamed protein product [Phytomonas sp. isolate EM1]